MLVFPSHHWLFFSFFLRVVVVVVVVMVVFTLICSHDVTFSNVFLCAHPTIFSFSEKEKNHFTNVTSTDSVRCSSPTIRNTASDIAG